MNEQEQKLRASLEWFGMTFDQKIAAIGECYADQAPNTLQVNIRFNEHYKALALKIGDGNLSEGIRRALKGYAS